MATRSCARSKIANQPSSSDCRRIVWLFCGEADCIGSLWRQNLSCAADIVWPFVGSAGWLVTSLTGVALVILLARFLYERKIFIRL
jgi:hypothetical protein